MEGFKNNKFCCYHCSLAESCRTLCNPMDCSTLVSSALHNVLEFVQIHIHWVSDANEPSHPLSPSSPAAFNLSQHQDLFQWVGSSNQVAKVLELQHYPSNKHSGLISFRTDWFYLPAVQGTLKSLLQHNWKASVPRCSAIWSNSHTHTWLLEKR